MQPENIFPHGSTDRKFRPQGMVGLGWAPNGSMDRAEGSRQGRDEGGVAGHASLSLCGG